MCMLLNMHKPNQGVFPLTPDELREAYRTQTDREIAATHTVSDALVSYYRRKFGIPTVTTRQRRETAAGGSGPSLDELTPAHLTALYGQMGDASIAALYGVARPAIRRLRTLWGIAPLSKTERASRGDVVLTDDQKETIIGTVLGDGHLSDHGVLKVTHAFHQVDYLRRTHAIMSPLSRPIYYEEKTQPDGVTCFAFGYTTAPHPWTQELYKVFYPAGVKVFPTELLDTLSARSLAYWYFDDGHRDDESNLPSFALGDISESAAWVVAQRVQARFGFDTYVVGHSLASSCKLMAIRAVSKETFFQIIKEFATPDMFHKLPKQHRPTGVPMVGRTYTLDPKLPQKLLVASKSWVTTPEADRGGVLGDLVEFWATSGFPYPTPKAEEILVLREMRQEHVLQEGSIKNRHVGQASCHAFARHIWSATSYGSTHSPRALFDDAPTLRDTLTMLLDSGRIPSASNLRSGLRYLRRSGVYNFRPSAAKVLTDRYCRPGGTVFDPCAGYGGRLFGVLLSDARPRYIACEPQSETYTRLHDLRDWLDQYLPGTAARVTLHNVPAEDLPALLDGTVDMVLTSPPYWKREVYGTEPTQSSVRYPTYSGWLSGFLAPVLRKAVRAVRDGGWIVLNVDDFTIGGVVYPLIADTCQIMSDLGLGAPTESFRYDMPVGTNPDNHEMVLCWTRGASVQDITVMTPPDEVFSRCSKCGVGIPAASLHTGVCPVCVVGAQKPDAICRGCGNTFQPNRGDHLFHDKACHARWRRVQHRKVQAQKTNRTFTCQGCGTRWDTDLPGRFTHCKSCHAQQGVAQRTRVCTYRHCGKTFTDGSSQNTAKFCSVECRRREKLFRNGIAKDVTYFRKP